ncbi:MAG: hypothetical protein ABIJ56_09120 [Pseudomonadota bacterium]
MVFPIKSLCRRFLSTLLFLLVFSCCACGAKSCRGKPGPAAAAEAFVPADVKTLAGIDVKGLSSAAAGKKIIDSLIKKEDCLYPLASGRAERLVAGWRQKGSPPFLLLACTACGIDSLAACAKKDFGLLFEQGPAIDGIDFMRTADGIWLGEPERSIFIAGLEQDVKAAMAARAGEKPSLQGSGQAAFLRTFIPAKALAEVMVIEGGDLARDAAGAGHSFAAELIDAKQAGAGLVLDKGRLVIEGTVILPKGSDKAAGRRVQTMKKELAKTAANPLLQKLGFSYLVERIHLEAGGEGHINVSFAMTEKELFDLIEAGRDVLAIEL